MVSIAAIAMSNYKMVYGGNDAAQTDNKFGVWFNVQRNPNTWHFLWKWTVSGLLILNMNIPLVPIESICGSPDPFTVTITDLDLEMAGFPSEQWQGTFKKGSEGHEAQQPPWQSWCWPLWTLRCHAEPHRGCETGVAQMARALDLEMAGFPSEQWQGTFKQEVWAMRLSSHTDKAGAGHSEHFAAMQNHIAVVEQGLLRWRGFGPRDGWLPKRAMAGHLQKGSEGHEAKQPMWQSWCWPLWTLQRQLCQGGCWASWPSLPFWRCTGSSCLTHN